MAEKVLNSRIKLRCDTYANWAAQDPILLSGELAAVVLSQNGTGDDMNDSLDTVLFKVGNGKDKFSDLGWTSSLSADVYEWAKAAVKPQYSYAEINNTPIIETDLSTLKEVATNRIYCHTGADSTNFEQGHLYHYNNEWIDLLYAENTVKSLLGSHKISELGDLAWLDENSLANVYTVRSSDISTVQAFRTLYESHVADSKNYIYDFSEFDSAQSLKYCYVSFTDTSVNSFFIVRDLQTGKEYSDSLGYLYNSIYSLADYFNGMNIGYPFKVIKVTRTDLTFSFINTALSQINTIETKVFFDLSSLLDRAYFCTISIDSNNNIAKVQDLINGKYAEVTFDNTTLLTDIIPYVETPIKVYTELPTSGGYVGDMCLVKNYGWRDLNSDKDLIVGKVYQLKIPAGTACFSYSSVGNYVEVLNMTVKTSGKEAQTYYYDAEYDSLVHTGSFTTKDKFYIATSIDKENRTFIGYDLTTSTGDTEFLATGVYNGKNVTVSNVFLAFLSVQQDSYSAPKLWTGSMWSDITSKYDISVLQDVLTRVVDLSYYNIGDEISSELAETLKQYKSAIKYSGAELDYIKTTDETALGYSEVLTYHGVEFINYHPYLKALVVGKSTKDSKWYLVTYETPKLAAYSSDNDTLHIYADSDEKFTIVSNDSTKSADIKIDTTQSDVNITLTLPKINGTLAVLSDTELTSSKITTALGYVPYDGATNPNNYITKAVSNLSNYYTKIDVENLIKNTSGGTSSAEIQTLLGTHDLAALGDGAWMSQDDILNVVNSSYTPEVTESSMNTAIDTKISEALAALEFNKYYTGTAIPADTFGNDGDLYLQQ